MVDDGDASAASAVHLPACLKAKGEGERRKGKAESERQKAKGEGERQRQKAKGERRKRGEGKVSDVGEDARSRRLDPSLRSVGRRRPHPAALCLLTFDSAFLLLPIASAFCLMPFAFAYDFCLLPSAF